MKQPGPRRLLRARVSDWFRRTPGVHWSLPARFATAPNARSILEFVSWSFFGMPRRGDSFNVELEPKERRRAPPDKLYRTLALWWICQPGAGGMTRL